MLLDVPAVTMAVIFASIPVLSLISNNLMPLIFKVPEAQVEKYQSRISNNEQEIFSSYEPNQSNDFLAYESCNEL